MENRTFKGHPTILARSQSAQKLKFKEIPFNQPGYNELNSKYQLYKRGTPNKYSSDLQVLRAKNIKNQIAMMDLPAIQSIISQLAVNEEEQHVNQRDYSLYPNLLRQPKGRYKEMLSEKQEIKDFILWFENEFQNIEKSDESYPRKFENKQTLIAAGFNEMIGQVAKTSKNRAEILKMLWNRQSVEVGRIVEVIGGQNIKKECSLLEQINKIHCEYQREIESLQKRNRELEENYKEESVFNRTLVENLRVMRKRIKKLEHLVKKLSESNHSIKRENLNLIEENVKLLINIKDISEEEALMLNYRRLQVYKEREKLKKQKSKTLLDLAQLNKQQEKTTSVQQLESKKKALLDYFLERLRQNPDQKVFIKEEYFTDDEENIASIEEYFKTIINQSNIKMELLNQNLMPLSFRQKGINTEKIQKIVLPQFNLFLEKGTQVEMSSNELACLAEEVGTKDLERQVYQNIPIAEEIIQKQSKKQRQERISRKNSITLLHVQSLGKMGSKHHDKKGTALSKFSKKGKQEETNAGSGNYIDRNESQIPPNSFRQCSSEANIIEIDTLSRESELSGRLFLANTEDKQIKFSNGLAAAQEEGKEKRSYP